MLAKLVDGIIFVVKANKVPRKEIQKTIDTLGKEKILGVVFNGFSHIRRSYGKYYASYYKKKR
jgi:Mrp family chromosome partitioning ATPase